LNDYLKELCADLNIALVYTNNKLTILSCGVNNNKPIIRVHKMFKDTNKKIAKAIINYYTDYEQNDKHLKIIKNYIDKKYPSMKCKIKEPTEAFIEYLRRNVNQLKMDANYNLSTGELYISQITKKDFWGNRSSVKPKESISVADDEVLELEILVSPNKR